MSYSKPPHRPHLTWKHYAFLGAILCAATATFLAAGQRPVRDAELDTALREALERFGAVSSYEQYVETRAYFPERTLLIEGVYRVDRDRRRYESAATTTLLFPGGPDTINFQLRNVALGRYVYVDITTASPVLKDTIPANRGWQRFSADAIPAEYDGIALPGPILDNMLILSREGALLSEASLPERVREGETDLIRYAFTVAAAPTAADGTLRALIERIGEGAVMLWLRADTREPVRLAFVTDTYRSTTTLSHLGEDLGITPPPAFR